MTLSEAATATDGLLPPGHPEQRRLREVPRHVPRCRPLRSAEEHPGAAPLAFAGLGSRCGAGAGTDPARTHYSASRVSPLPNVHVRIANSTPGDVNATEPITTGR